MTDPKEQRLVNLVIALKETSRRMTFDELRTRTGYYQQPDVAAARRQFERDKADLLAIGVPLTVGPIPFGEGTGYTIDRKGYALPAIELAPDEVAALSVALRAAGDSATTHGLAKLTARAPDPDGSDGSGLPAVLSVDEPPVEVLAATRERRQLRFHYRNSRGEVRARHLHPYRVAQRRGAWYVRGHDVDAGELRTFRLDRVVGTVEVGAHPGAFPPPTRPEERGFTIPKSPGVSLELFVAPEQGWLVSTAGGWHVDDLARPDVVPESWLAFRIDDIERSRAVTLVLGLGDQAALRGPADVREDVLAALDRVLGLAEPAS